MKKIKAFTLAEILIVISVIGVLATIMLTSLSGMTPDKTKILYKKAYQVTERTVGELVNDEEYYPFDREKIGFRNTEFVAWLGAGKNDFDEQYGGRLKFCRLFARKLNTMGDGKYNDTGNSYNFTTSDNIYWQVPCVDFTNQDSITIVVDVDTSNKGLDKRTGTEYGDQFHINVYYDGTVEPKKDCGGGECIEQKFLKSHSVQKDKK